MKSKVVAILETRTGAHLAELIARRRIVTDIDHGVCSAGCGAGRGPGVG